MYRPPCCAFLFQKCRVTYTLQFKLNKSDRSMLKITRLGAHEGCGPKKGKKDERAGVAAAIARSSEVKIYSPGVHRAGRHMPRGVPAERARAWVQAVLQQLEAVWDECTCAGAALLATFSLSSLQGAQEAVAHVWRRS